MGIISKYWSDGISGSTTPTPASVSSDKYAHWKPFISEGHLYEFKYPQTWFVIGAPGLTVFMSPGSHSGKLYILDSNDNVSRLPIDQYLRTGFNPRPFKVYGIIDGVEAVVSWGNPSTINFTKGKYVFRVTAEWLDDKDVRDILNTLRVSPFKEIKTELTEPYLTWEEEGGSDVTHFFLIGASLGDVPATSGLLKFPAEGEYQKGEIVYALTLKLRIYKPETGRVPLLLTRIIDEAGISARPNTPMFKFEGSGDDTALAYSTYIHDVTFVVPEYETEFLFRTSNSSNKFFILKKLGAVCFSRVLSIKDDLLYFDVR